MKPKDLIPFLDLTSLGALDRVSDAISLANRAKTTGCAAVCIYPRFIPPLKEVGVKIATVCAFPHGQVAPHLKASEAEKLIELGADEIDMVASIGAIRECDWDHLFSEVSAVKKACGDKVLKVILETSLLETLQDGDTLIRKASQISCEAGSDFLKTSTGKEPGGASAKAVKIFCEEVKSYFTKSKRRVGIKPSGGIKSISSAIDFSKIVEDVLGNEWLDPNLFRLGASSLLDAILAEDK